MRKLSDFFNVREDNAKKRVTYFIDVGHVPDGFEDAAESMGVITDVGFQDVRGNSLFLVQGHASAVMSLFQRFGVRRYLTANDVYRDPESDGSPFSHSDN